jgi:hypothetical protein
MACKIISHQAAVMLFCLNSASHKGNEQQHAPETFYLCRALAAGLYHPCFASPGTWLTRLLKR